MTNRRALRTRPYRSELRDEQARTTRRAIVAAAARLFTERGYGAASIDDIAEAAGVSRATVFGAFGDKATLLKRAYDVAAVGDDEPVALRDRPVAKAIIAERDPRRLLEMYAEMCTDLGRRLSPMYEAVRGASAVDPEARPVLDEVEHERDRGSRSLVKLLVERGALRRDLTPDVAADIVFAMTDPDTYLLFLRDRGWPEERYESWLASTLATQLLRPTRAHRGRRRAAS